MTVTGSRECPEAGRGGFKDTGDGTLDAGMRGADHRLRVFETARLQRAQGRSIGDSRPLTALGR